MTPTLRTERLVLRRHGSEDAEPIAHYLNNFAVAGNLATVPYPYKLADAQWWLESLSPPKDQVFAIELPGAGYVGTIGFHHCDSTPRLGYWLAQPFWHRGLMTEAAAAVIDWYFDSTDTGFIHCGAFAFNKASLAIQRKLGFTETTVAPMRCLARNEEVRHIDTKLSRSDWAKRVERGSSVPVARATDKDSR